MVGLLKGSRRAAGRQYQDRMLGLRGPLIDLSSLYGLMRPNSSFLDKYSFVHRQRTCSQGLLETQGAVVDLPVLCSRYPNLKPKTTYNYFWMSRVLVELSAPPCETMRSWQDVEAHLEFAMLASLWGGRNLTLGAQEFVL